MKKSIFLLLLLLARSLPAQVPNEFVYTGSLREYGQTVNGTRTMCFELYTAPTGGVAAWSSGDVNVNVSSGIFSCSLSPAVDWCGGNYWIQTTVSRKILAPREKISAQAYAFHAGSAEGLERASGAIPFSIGGQGKGSITPAGEMSCLVNGTTFYLVPRGFIGLWSGSVGDIPAGWALCDGKWYDPAELVAGQRGQDYSDGAHTVRTPNLEDRFVVGAGASYTPGATGGAATHSHNIDHWHNVSMNDHTHTFSHTHSVSGSTSGPNRTEAVTGGGASAASQDHAHTFSVTSSGPSTSTTSSASNLSGKTGMVAGTVNGLTGPAVSGTASSLPPYFALAYIMRL